MPRGKRLFRVLAASFCALLLAGLLLALLLPVSGEPDFLRTGEPNGYEIYLRAAAALNESQPPGLTNQFAVLLAMNQEALQLWHEALERPAETPASRYLLANVPDQYSLMQDAAQFKKLALAAKAAALDAEREQKFDQAVQFYLDIIRTGQAIEFGPMISLYSGLSIEAIGLDGLAQLERKLKAEQKAEISAKLQTLNSQRIPFDEVVKREKYFLRRNTPSPIHHLLFQFSPARRRSIEAGRRKYEIWEAQMGQTARERRGGAGQDAEVQR